MKFEVGQLVQLSDGSIHKVKTTGKGGKSLYTHCMPTTERWFAVTVKRSVPLMALCPTCFGADDEG